MILGVVIDEPGPAITMASRAAYPLSTSITIRTLEFRHMIPPKSFKLNHAEATEIIASRIKTAILMDLIRFDGHNVNTSKPWTACTDVNE
jgi:hypothetical protein